VTLPFILNFLIGMANCRGAAPIHQKALQKDLVIFTENNKTWLC